MHLILICLGQKHYFAGEAEGKRQIEVKLMNRLAGIEQATECYMSASNTLRNDYNYKIHKLKVTCLRAFVISLSTDYWRANKFRNGFLTPQHKWMHRVESFLWQIENLSSLRET